jgi:hypothetical protein
MPNPRYVRSLLIPGASFLLVGLFLATSAAGGVSPALLLTAPYRGHSFEKTYTYSPPGCAQVHSFSPPRFNKTTGIASVVQESKVMGARCPNQSSSSNIQSSIEFNTRNFNVAGGAHQFVVTWNVSWTANISKVGGNKTSYATFDIGVSWTELCSATTSYCIDFQNGGGGGSITGGHPAWNADGGVPSGKGRHSVYSVNQTSSANVNVDLNSTFNTSGTYYVIASLTTTITAAADGIGHHATSDLWMSAKLVSITMH